MNLSLLLLLATLAATASARPLDRRGGEFPIPSQPRPDTLAVIVDYAKPAPPTPPPIAPVDRRGIIVEQVIVDYAKPAPPTPPPAAPAVDRRGGKGAFPLGAANPSVIIEYAKPAPTPTPPPAAAVTPDANKGPGPYAKPSLAARGVIVEDARAKEGASVPDAPEARKGGGRVKGGGG
ncbi:hypothetical protein HDU96_003646 [Phlyctochytrium bullatum]|nr:hypothetical protein HDU96_003646 [Phlyctochytrium bullatum]